MASSPSMDPSDAVELSLLAGDSLDEADPDPVSVVAGGGRALPPRRSRSAARTAIALEVSGEVPDVCSPAGSTHRGSCRRSGVRGRGRGLSRGVTEPDGALSGALGGVSGTLAVGALPAPSLPLTAQGAAGQAGAVRESGRLGAASSSSGEGGLVGDRVAELPVLTSTSGMGPGLPAGPPGWWLPWMSGHWGAPWGSAPWAMVPPPFPGVVPPSTWGAGAAMGGGSRRLEVMGDRQAEAWTPGLTFPHAAQVAGPCLDFFPQDVIAGRESRAGPSAAGVSSGGHAAVQRPGSEEPVLPAGRISDTVVAADGATPGADVAGKGRTATG
uniref:Ras association domain-containing protein 6 isoform X2 n=1 Tax=Geotrypetes seraphini TaxID=260995 RepID=A0A6P8SGX4_GEOSA|nr:ras association domain-containing protein 6 isoform X2 [Geotrypetes seraphini]XP_033817681.1 ras association domain-containing protein 6 isoform X2 [Geotrypetes seraphini]XP_033817691.1 ras association domain-containing protein 6 isoform X2 [Geotrypetes seraphini]